MVNVDTVYQRVLAIANKEQRGYITPLEFNLLANQAQLETFEGYFAGLNETIQLPGIDSPYADLTSILEDKISVFQENIGTAQFASFPIAGANFRITLPDDIYRIVSLYVNDSEAEKLNHIHFAHVKKQGPLTRPTPITPVYNLQKNFLRIHNGSPVDPNGVDIGMHYIRKPIEPKWGYVVTNEQALYNASSSTNFELHASEEVALVAKILGLAGIIMQKDLTGAPAQQ